MRSLSLNVVTKTLRTEDHRVDVEKALNYE